MTSSSAKICLKRSTADWLPGEIGCQRGKSTAHFNQRGRDRTHVVQLVGQERGSVMRFVPSVLGLGQRMRERHAAPPERRDTRAPHTTSHQSCGVVARGWLAAREERAPHTMSHQSCEMPYARHSVCKGITLRGLKIPSPVCGAYLQPIQQRVTEFMVSARGCWLKIRVLSLVRTFSVVT
jgi:hypothetical protein